MSVTEDLKKIPETIEEAVALIDELSRVSASVAVTVGGHQSIGFKGLLLFGTKEQKQK